MTKLKTELPYYEACNSGIEFIAISSLMVIFIFQPVLRCFGLGQKARITVTHLRVNRYKSISNKDAKKPLKDKWNL